MQPWTAGNVAPPQGHERLPSLCDLYTLTVLHILYAAQSNSLSVVGPGKPKGWTSMCYNGRRKLGGIIMG